MGKELVVLMETVRNLSTCLSSTSIRNEKVKHYIKIKMYKFNGEYLCSAPKPLY